MPIHVEMPGDAYLRGPQDSNDGIQNIQDAKGLRQAAEDAYQASRSAATPSTEIDTSTALPRFTPSPVKIDLSSDDISIYQKGLSGRARFYRLASDHATRLLVTCNGRNSLDTFLGCCAEHMLNDFIENQANPDDSSHRSIYLGIQRIAQLCNERGIGIKGVGKETRPVSPEVATKTKEYRERHPIQYQDLKSKVDDLDLARDGGSLFKEKVEALLSILSENEDVKAVHQAQIKTAVDRELEYYDDEVFVEEYAPEGGENTSETKVNQDYLLELLHLEKKAVFLAELDASCDTKSMQSHKITYLFAFFDSAIEDQDLLFMDLYSNTPEKIMEGLKHSIKLGFKKKTHLDSAEFFLKKAISAGLDFESIGQDLKASGLSISDVVFTLNKVELDTCTELKNSLIATMTPDETLEQLKLLDHFISDKYDSPTLAHTHVIFTRLKEQLSFAVKDISTQRPYLKAALDIPIVKKLICRSLCEPQVADSKWQETLDTLYERRNDPELATLNTVDRSDLIVNPNLADADASILCWNMNDGIGDLVHGYTMAKNLKAKYPDKTFNVVIGFERPETMSDLRYENTKASWIERFEDLGIDKSRVIFQEAPRNPESYGAEHMARQSAVHQAVSQSRCVIEASTSFPSEYQAWDGCADVPVLKLMEFDLLFEGSNMAYRKFFGQDPTLSVCEARPGGDFSFSYDPSQGTGLHFDDAEFQKRQALQESIQSAIHNPDQDPDALSPLSKYLNKTMPGKDSLPPNAKVIRDAFDFGSTATNNHDLKTYLSNTQVLNIYNQSPRPGVIQKIIDLNISARDADAPEKPMVIFLRGNINPDELKKYENMERVNIHVLPDRVPQDVYDVLGFATDNGLRNFSGDSSLAECFGFGIPICALKSYQSDETSGFQSLISEVEARVLELKGNPCPEPYQHCLDFLQWNLDPKATLADRFFTVDREIRDEFAGVFLQIARERNAYGESSPFMEALDQYLYLENL